MQEFKKERNSREGKEKKQRKGKKESQRRRKEGEEERKRKKNREKPRMLEFWNPHKSAQDCNSSRKDWKQTKLEDL